MNWPEPSRVRGLSGWLIIATFELAAPAKERIRLEIEAHYVDAVQYHLTNGATQATAEAAALAELGDARVAAKRFRWRHLTEKDADYIETQLNYARSNFGILFSFAIFVVLLLWPLRHESLLFDFHRTFRTALLIGWVMVQTAIFLMAKKNAFNSNLRLLVSLQAIGILIFSIILLGNSPLLCVIFYRPL